MTISDRDWELLNGLSDGELDASTAATLKRRIADEPDLKAAFETIEASREAIQKLGKPVVSEQLQQRIEAVVGAVKVEAAPRRRGGGFASWQQLAASVAATAIVASTLTYMVMAPSSATAIDELVTSSHRRSLLAATPVDVQSSDRHTVKPWLDSRIGLSPPAPDLKDQQFALIGGRVDVIGQEPVPSLVYRHNEHTITLLAMPGASASVAPRTAASGGYNVVRWTDNGFSYWAVSDLESGELRQFADDFRNATAASAPRE